MFMTVDQALGLLDEVRIAIKEKVEKAGSNDKVAGNYLTRFVNKKLPTWLHAYESDGKQRAMKLTSHDLRRIYANVAYDKASRDSTKKININAFISSILGHATADMASAVSYASLYIDYNK
jgi:integrase